MQWETVAQVATALGVLVAAASVASVYIMYRIGQREEYASALRLTIVSSRSICHRLNMLLDYELANELAGTVSYSRDFELTFLDAYNLWFSDDKKEIEEEALQTLIGPITVPIQTPTVNAYEKDLLRIEQDMARYQRDFPALYRVLSGAAVVFRNILRNAKELVRNEDTARFIFRYLAETEQSAIDSVERLRFRYNFWLIVLGIRKTLDNDQADIDDILEMLDLVTDAYLALDDRGVAQASARERKVTLIPLASTTKISEDLREAEKALEYVLTAQQLRDYREKVVRFEQRNSGKPRP